MTARQWKQHKRHEARVLHRMINNFSFGSALTPAYPFIYKLQGAIADIREAIKVKNWGN